MAPPEERPAVQLGATLVQDEKADALGKIHRYRTTEQRTLLSLMRELREAQHERRGKKVEDGSEVIDVSCVRDTYTSRTANGQEENDV